MKTTNENKKPSKSKQLFSVIILLIASVIWGLAFSAQKGAGGLGGFTVGASRNLFAVLFLIPIIPLMDRITKNGRSLIKNRRPDFTRSEIIGGIISGTFMTFATALQQNGIRDGTDAGKAGFITALYVVIVPIYAMFFGKKSPPKVWISIAIAVIGFYLLSVKSDFSIVASDIMILMCSFIFAGQIMAIDIFSERCEGIRLSLIQFISGFIINLIFAFILEGPIDLNGISESILSLIYLGVFSSGIAYTLQVIGQKNLNPGVASILLSLESVFGAIGGALIYGEAMNPRETVGCIIVFAAVVLSQLDFAKRPIKENNSSQNQ